MDNLDESAAGRLNTICGVIAAGRIAARNLASQVRVLGLSETQVRLLWFLRSTELAADASKAPPDQTRLAAGLGFSAAQISSVVDTLREQGAVVSKPAPGDRRRQIWQLTPAGLEWTERILVHVARGTGPHGSRLSSDNPDSLSTSEAA
jgi:DNA-binding MarR family transcriptional regulator